MVVLLLAEARFSHFNCTLSYVFVSLVGDAIGQSLQNIIGHKLESLTDQILLIEGNHFLEGVDRI
jgi:hypothetical protein